MSQLNAQKTHRAKGSLLEAVKSSGPRLDGKGVNALFGKAADQVRLSRHQIKIRDQVRKQFEDEENTLAELAASIKELGIIEPLVVRPAEGLEPGTYELVCGERRLSAAEMAGVGDNIPAIIMALTDEEARRVQIAENTHRMGLTLIDEALAIQRDMEELGSMEAVAEKWHKSLSWVSKKIRLARLSPESAAIKAVERGISADEEVIAGIATVEKHDPAAAEQLVETLASVSVNAREAVEAAKNQVRPRKKRQPEGGDAPPAPAEEAGRIRKRSVLAPTEVAEQDVCLILDNIAKGISGGSPVKEILATVSGPESSALMLYLKSIYDAVPPRQQDQANALAKGIRDGFFTGSGAGAIRLAAFWCGVHKLAFDPIRLYAYVS